MQRMAWPGPVSSSTVSRQLRASRWNRGAIVPRFQREALSCRETVLLETGPGHAIRCIPTPYAEAFEREKRRLQEEGRSADEVREALEAMNIGRLRVASKGIDRASP